MSRAGAIGLLQSTGIASQAGDHYDRLRAGDRRAAQQEEMTQMGIDEAVIWRELVKMAAMHNESERAKKTAKAPTVSAPTAPAINPAWMSDDAGAGSGGKYANGGPIMPAAVDKFDGIYDDAKITDRMPTIFKEWQQDRTTKMANGGFINAARGIGDAMRAHAMANGGMVPGATNNVFTPSNFANGGSVNKVDRNKVMELFANGGMIGGYVKQCMTPPKKAVRKRVRGKKKGVKKMAGGGHITGPGTGTSDSVPAVGPGNRPIALSNGEYVLSADTVRAVGKHNLDALQAKYHKPV